MQYLQHLRGIFFFPLFGFLIRRNITANHITCASLILGIIACPLLLWSTIAGIVMLLLHVLVDGLDGSLARHTGTSSGRGSFIDTSADQIVITFTTITFMYMHLVSIAAGSIYIFIYAITAGFAMLRNAMAIPYPWVIRPRFLVYAWLPVAFYIWPGSMNELLWLCNIPLAITTVTGFIQISKKL